MVQSDRVTINIDSHRLRARSFTMPTLDIVGNDVEVCILDHVVGTDAHEIITLAVKGHIVRVTYGGACSLTSFVGTLPLASGAGTEMNIFFHNI